MLLVQGWYLYCIILNVEFETSKHVISSVLSMFFKRGIVPPYCNSVPLNKVYRYTQCAPLYFQRLNGLIVVIKNKNGTEGIFVYQCSHWARALCLLGF